MLNFNCEIFVSRKNITFVDIVIKLTDVQYLWRALLVTSIKTNWRGCESSVWSTVENFSENHPHGYKSVVLSLYTSLPLSCRAPTHHPCTAGVITTGPDGKSADALHHKVPTTVVLTQIWWTARHLLSISKRPKSDNDLDDVCKFKRTCTNKHYSSALGILSLLQPANFSVISFYMLVIVLLLHSYNQA